MPADILPTGYEVGVLNSSIRPGDVVAVVGAGPISRSAIMGGQLYRPSPIVTFDLADCRLAAAKQFGADVVVNHGRQVPAAAVPELAAASASMSPSRPLVPSHLRARCRPRATGWARRTLASTANQSRCTSRSCGPRTSITTVLVDIYSPPAVLRLLRGHLLDASRFVTHHFALDEFEDASL